MQFTKMIATVSTFPYDRNLSCRWSWSYTANPLNSVSITVIYLDSVEWVSRGDITDSTNPSRDEMVHMVIPTSFGHHLANVVVEWRWNSTANSGC